jgi:hypothetical protein
MKFRVIFSFILRAKSFLEKECYSFRKLNIGKGREKKEENYLRDAFY